MDKKIDILITKFLSGNTTEEENNQMQTWRNERSENEAYFDAFKAAWDRAGIKQEETDVDVDWAFNDLQQRIGEEAPVKRRAFLPLRIAAGFLLLVVLSVVLALIFTDTSEKPPMVAMQKVPTTVDTDSRKAIVPDTFVVNEIAEPVRSKARVKPRKKKQTEQLMDLFTLVTTDSAKAFLLPDNSIVYLNEHSTLSYAKDFNVHSRKVSIEGEAYFEISRDSLPFEVACRNTITRGTEASFNIRSYQKDEQVELIIVSGSAEFTGVGKKDFKKLNLTKGESGIAKKNGKVIKTTVQRKDYKWWQKKNLRNRFKRFIAKIKVIFE